MNMQNVKALYRRAQAYMATADFMEAEVDLKRAAHLEPENAEVKALMKKLKLTEKVHCCPPPLTSSPRTHHRVSPAPFHAPLVMQGSFPLGHSAPAARRCRRQGASKHSKRGETASSIVHAIFSSAPEVSGLRQ
jgi:hypothetical protein